MTRLLPCLALILVLPACQFGRRVYEKQSRLLDPAALEQPDAFRDPLLESGQVQRVLALPLMDETPQGDGSLVISQAVRDELFKLRRFDLVQANPGDAALQPGNGPKQTGRIEVATIIELGRRYGVDAVLFGALDHYRPYDPPAVGMSLSLVDVETGRIIWHVRDFIDGADQRTALAMRYYFEDETARDEVFESDLMSTAPQWFARFAAQRVANSMVPPPPTP